MDEMRMRTYLALIEVGAPEPQLIKVRAISFLRAEQKVRDHFGISTRSGVLGIWALDDIEEFDVARGSEAFHTRKQFRRRPEVSVRTHVRRK